MRSRPGFRAAARLPLLLALGCQLVLAQVGPRHVIELHGNGNGGGGEAGPAKGQVQLAGKGLALIRFQGLRILTVEADADAYRMDAVRHWPEADLLLLVPASAGRYGGLAPLKALRRMPVIAAEPAGYGVPSPADVPQYYPMQAWDTLALRKHATRLRVTAMPGPPGTAAVAGFMLEVGNRRFSYRVYVSCVALADAQIAGLSQRLPGADLALLPTRDAPELLALHRSARAAGRPAALTVAGYAFTAIKR